jgi:hypothetical protein
MGVTTGPWEYRQKSLRDTPVAHGHFTTIWKKKDNGEWKAMMDMGISYPQNITNSGTSKKLVLKNYKEVISDTIFLMTKEMNFINAFKNAEAINSAMDLLAPNIFTPAGVITSKTNDMFVAFGEAQSEDKKQGYMRVWIKDGDEWKLLLMVIS